MGLAGRGRLYLVNWYEVIAVAYNRDEDILYLAHQLWEEDETPTASAHAYWQDAARQILARGPVRKQANGPDDIGMAPARPVKPCLHIGPSWRIEMGAATGPRRVLPFRHDADMKVANPAVQLVRRVD